MSFPSWSRRAVVVGAAIVIAATAWSGARAQEQRRGPEPPINLKVLPKDIDPRQLHEMMEGFGRALGVGCSHCHAIERGTRPTEKDWASDSNPAKDVARRMIKMMHSIDEQLAPLATEGETIHVSCMTCHRGRPEPTTLIGELRDAYAHEGASGAVGHYQELRERFLNRGSYDFGEGTLNNFGYELLMKGDQQGAIAILRLNAEQFPQSGNVWDSLAEAYLDAGQREIAEIYYRKSLELDPENKNALEKLAEIRGEKKPAEQRHDDD